MEAEVLPGQHRLARITSRTEVCVEYRTPSGHSARPSGRANPVCGYPVHIDFPHVEVRGTTPEIVPRGRTTCVHFTYSRWRCWRQQQMRTISATFTLTRR